MPALSSRTKARVLFFATMLAPIVIVQGARVLLGGTPVSSASAANADPGLAITPPPAAPLTDAQRRAITWIAGQPASLPLRSPMDRPDPPPIIVHLPITPAPEPAIPQPTQPPAPTFILSAIIGSSSSGGSEQALASINHRIYRVGDEITRGWRIADIDSRSRTVTVLGPDQQRITLTPPTPSLRRP